MIGHIRLDGVSYCLPNERQITRSNANQMSAKIGSGAGDYDDQLNWNNFLMDSWEAGVGKKDPRAGGFLSATLDTRHKQQVSLAGMVRHIASREDFTDASDNVLSNSPNYEIVAGTITTPPVLQTLSVGPDEDITKLANVFFPPSGGGITEVTYLMEALLPGMGDAQAVKIELWSCTGTTPNALMYSETFQLVDRAGWFWYSKQVTTTIAEATGDNYFAMVVEPLFGTLDIPTTTAALDFQWQYDGATWTTTVPSFLARFQEVIPGDDISHIAYLGTKTYFSRGDVLFSYDGSVMEIIDVLDADISDLFALDDRLYIGQGNGTDHYAYMGTLETVAYADVPGNKFSLIDGLLWRSLGPGLYYTSDEVSWFFVDVGLTSRENITGFAGLNGEIIASTNRAIYRIIQGDTTAFMSAWGAPSDTNGAHMIVFQGNLYISQGESVIRFDGENFLPYGPDLGEGLPTHFAGPIVGFAANNNWLACAVAGSTGSMWIHNGQGWHFGAELPQGLTATTIAYTTEDTGFSLFLIGSEALHSVSISDTRKAMRKASLLAADDYQFHHFTGWLETDWFYGELREVQKDWESIYVDSENISTENYIEVYWQEAEDEDWQLLGTITEPQQELRWDDYSVRPAGSRIRVAIAMYNSFLPGSPVGTAIRVKYMPMVTDRWRWQVPIEVKKNQEMPDGKINDRSVAEMITHLDGLTKQVPPVIFGDLDLSEYEVKVMNATRTPTRVEYSKVTETLDVEWMYNLVLEQVTADAITAS